MRSKLIVSLTLTLGFLILLMGCQKLPDNCVLSFDGVPIVFEDVGEGEPTLMFVHGWSCDQKYWQDQVEYFSKKYRTVTLDLAGHGESGTDRDTWAIENFGRDVVAVMDALDLKDVVLIGHSMGGSVILETVRRVPERVLGIVGVDTYQDVTHRPTLSDIQTFMEPMKEDYVTATKNFVGQVLFTPDADSALVHQVAEDMAAAPSEIAIGALESAWLFDIAEALTKIDKPVHCINSDYFPVNIEAARSCAQRFSVTFLSDVGHFLFLEKPAEFNQHLEDTIIAFRSIQSM